MTKKPGTGSIVHSFDVTLVKIKPDPILLFDILDEILQELSTRHLAGATMVDVGDCTVDMSVRYSEGHGAK